MTFRKLMLLGGVGGLIYAHRKRGGEMTLASFKESGRDLIEGVRSRITDLRSEAETRLHDAASKVAERTHTGLDSASTTAGDRAGFGSSGYEI